MTSLLLLVVCLALPMAAVTYNPSSISMGSSGGSVTISWTGGDGYYTSATPNVGWITVTTNTSTPTAGNIEIYINQNYSTTARSGSVRVCLGSCTDIAVSQAGAFIFSVSVTPSDLYPDAAGGSGTISATPNGGNTYTVDVYDDWIHITSATTLSGNATISYTIDANTTGSERYTEFYIYDATVTVTQAAAPVTGSLTLSPTSASVASSGTTGTVAATSNLGTYAWTAVSNNAWITVTSGASTTGSGSVGYSVAANTSVASRSGSITIGDKTFSITQAGLTGSVTLSPASLSAASGGESGSVAATANASDYAWTAVSNNAWITVTSGASTTGSGSVGYTVAAATTVATRTGSITIGDKTFSVTQAGLTGSLTLSPASLSAAAGGESGSVTATSNATDYAWTAVSNNGWITVTSGASSTGSGSVGYSVAANTSIASRTGSVTIGDKTFSVTQAGLTGSVTLSPASLSAGSGGESGSVTVTSNATDYAWTAASNDSWITVTSGASTTGNGSVGYTVAANASTVARTGSITIGDKTFSVTQAGVAGSVTLSSSSLNAVAAGESGSVTVTANVSDFAWTAVSNNAWITVTSGASTTGNGSVGFGIAAATTVATRTGSITIGDKTFSVTQAGLTGSVTLSPATANAVAGGESGSVAATSNATDYAWTAVSNNAWITVTSGASTTGSGAVGYTVAATTTVASRTGSITIGDKSFSITQSGVAGSVTLSSSSLNAVAAGESGSVTATANVSDYAWTAVSNNAWITVTSGASTTGNGTVGYTVAATTTVASRTGSITIGDKTFSVTQAGLTGSVTLGSASLSAAAAGESGSVAVSSNATDYAWTAVSNNAWITVTSGASSTGSGTVGYTVAAATTVASRTGSITIGDKTFSITQAGLTGSVTLSPASRTAVSAGESGSVAVTSNATDYAWTAVSNNAWITVTSGANSTGNGSVGYTVAAIATVASRTGSITIGDKSFSITQSGLTGSVTLSSSSVNAAAAGESHTLTVTANAPDYAWTAVSNNAWITVTTGASSTGSGSVGYTVAAATTVASRAGSITIGDKTFSVTQSGLTGSVTLGAASANAVAVGGNGSVAVTSNAPDYAWTAVSNNAWITVTSGASSTGSGAVGYAVAAATTVASRTGSITIGDKTFSITQAGLTGRVTLSAASLNAAAAGQSGTVTVTSNAPDYTWTAVSNNAWITVTSGASSTGNGAVGYTVAAATTVASRTGTITIGDKTFTVDQAGVTGSVTLSASSSAAAAVGQIGSVLVTSNATDFTWSAVSRNTWITITTGASTTGSGPVGFTVAETTSVASRSGSIAIGDKTFTVSQAGVAGSLTLSATGVDAAAEGQTGSVAVTSNATDYTWTAVSNNSWITVTSGANTSGSGSVGYSIASTSTVAPRRGSITIGENAFAINQAGMVGKITLNPASLNVGAAGESGTVFATSNASDFAWTAVSNNPWIVITSGASGTGNGSVGYTVSPSNTIAPRTGSITVGGTNFSVTQDGGQGSLDLGAGTLPVEAAGGTRTVTVTANYSDYAWTATSAATWIHVVSGATGTGNGSVVLDIARTDSAKPRTGTVTIGSKVVSVVQSGGELQLTLSATSIPVSATGETATVTVTANYADGEWTASAGASWLTLVSGPSYTGSATVTVQAAAQKSVQARSATVMVGGQNVSITQAGGQGELALSDDRISVEAAGGTRAVSLTSNFADYAWAASSSDAWIVVSPAGGTGSGTLVLQMSRLESGTSRVGTVTVEGRVITVTQSSGVIVSPDWISLSAPQGGSPAQQGITVISGASGTSFLATVSANTPWLTIDAEQDIAPATVTVTANPQGLAAGSYQGSVNINGQTVTVSFTVRKPLVSLSLSSLYFQKTNDGVDLAPKVIIVSSDGGPVRYAASLGGSNPGWLSLSNASGNVPGALQVSVSPAGLAEGEYNAVIVVTLAGASVETLTIPVTLRIPQLSVTVLNVGGSPVVGSQNVGNGQLNLSSNTHDPSQASPGAQLLVDSAAPQSFSASTTMPGGGSWLSVSPASGTTPATLNLSVDRAGLAPGTYTGYVNVSASDAAAASGSGSSTEARSKSVTLAVSFTVDAPAKTVSVSPSSLTVTRQQGDNTVEPFTLQVSGTVGQRFYVASAVNWIRVSPSSGQVPASVRVDIDPSYISIENVSGSISFTTPDAPGTPTLVPVEVRTLASAPALSLDQNWMELTGEEKAAAVSVPIRLASSSAGTPFVVTSTQPWLSAASSGGTAPATVTVAADPAGLKSGSYSGDLVFTSAATQLTLHVSFTVNPKPSFEVSGNTVTLRLMQDGTSGTEASLSLTARVRNVSFSTSVSGGTWLRVSPDSSVTPAVLRIATTAEALAFKAGTYLATVTVSSEDGAEPLDIPVMLAVDAGKPALDQPEVVSYAGRKGGAVAPGMLVVLSGLELPVPETVTANLDSRVAPQQLAGVRVLFDGMAGPVLSVGAAEVSAMVPYELGVKAATVVTLEYLGQAAAPVLVPMVAARPEVVPVAELAGSFARHPDGTPVSDDAPALPGSTIEIGATGLGLTEPELASTIVQTQSVPVSFGGNVQVSYHGKPAVVLFAGPKPGQVPGLIQINIRIPSDAPAAGDIAVALTSK